MASDDIQILNEPTELRRRESKSGKARFTVEIRSEPLLHNLSPKDLGRGVAEAIADVLRERVRSISAVAGEATMRARLSALKAFTLGKPWAQRRYSGGRTGPMPPARSDRAFNDSGRFAASIVAQPKDDGFTVNVAANRLDPTTTAGDEGVRRMWNRLVELVPEFGDPRRLMDDLRVRRAIDQGHKAMITKLEETSKRLGEARLRAAAGQIISGVRALAAI